MSSDNLQNIEDKLLAVETKLDELIELLTKFMGTPKPDPTKPRKSRGMMKITPNNIEAYERSQIPSWY